MSEQTPQTTARQQAAHISEVTKAYSEGKIVRGRRRGSRDTWGIFSSSGYPSSPSWNWEEYEYEVKPEERKPREFKICVCSDGSVLDFRDDEVRHTDEVILVREVLPETETES